MRPSSCSVSGSGLDGHDVDDPAPAARAEPHGTGRTCEERVVVATTDVLSGVEVGATLANDDLAGLDDLTTVALDAEALGVGIATVARGARALLMCHGEPAFVGREVGGRLADSGPLLRYLMPVTFRRVSFWR